MGRRKARRWVNDHLLGSAMLSQMSPDELAEEMENLDISERKTTTALAQLLQIAPEAVVAFRSGKGGPQGETDATKKSNATAKLKSFNGISHKSGPLARFQGKFGKRIRYSVLIPFSYRFVFYATRGGV